MTEDTKRWELSKYMIRDFVGDNKIDIREGEKLDTVFNMSPEDFKSEHELV